MLVKGRSSAWPATVLLVVSVAISSASAGGDASDLAARAKSWEAAFNSGDPAGVAAHYTEDAVRLPYQAPTIKGRAAIAADIRSTQDNGVAKIRLEVLGAESHGSIGWGHGTYELVDAQGEQVQQGKWLNVSKKVGGEWLIHSDIWNTDAP